MADEEEGARPTWEGQFDEDGLPHGKGVMTYPPPPAGDDGEEKPGDKYEGEMSHGARHGKGKYTWSNGASYDGSYDAGRRHGSGTMSFPDKSSYTGEFADNSPHGKGTYTYPNGDMYKGTWAAGQKQGKGTYVFKDSGSQYIGEWADGQFVNGMWVAADGSIFKGKFDRSLPVEGTHFFARSKLINSGKYAKSGAWKGGEVVAGQAQQVL